MKQLSSGTGITYNIEHASAIVYEQLYIKLDHRYLVLLYSCIEKRACDIQWYQKNCVWLVRSLHMQASMLRARLLEYVGWHDTP